MLANHLEKFFKWCLTDGALSQLKERQTPESQSSAEHHFENQPY